MATKEHRIRVAGHAPFPIDMLRYDLCIPSSETDAVIIHNSVAGPRVDALLRISLIHPCYCGTTRQHTWTPTERRWESFGWKVEYAS